MTNKTSTKRWAIRNKNTGTVRSYKATREQARASKKPNEIIFDTVNQQFVR